jgi:serine/threonine-protein kinase
MVLGERYRLEVTLGSGGMADVFRALDLITGRRVAVKVLRQQLVESPEAVQRFRREGQVLAALKNPAIVGVESVFEQPSGVFLVMELLEGETLGARMKRGPLSIRELAPIVAGCAAGLSAAHQHGVVHRDLKPDNVFLTELPSGEVQVKVLDFGVSKVRGEERLTQTGQVLGTPRYMSPEQLGAEPDVDARVDVYALGVILYEALSGGRSPFVASTPTDLIVAILNGKIIPLRSVKPDVPAAIEAVVLRSMSKVRAARYESVAGLAEAFFEAGAFELKAPLPAPAGTSALGSMRTVALGQQGGELALAATKLAPSEKAAPSEPLREGTFSELGAFDIKPGTPSAAPAQPAAIDPNIAATRSPRVIPPTAVSSAVEPAAPISETRPPDAARPAAPRVEVSDPGWVPEPAPAPTSPVRTVLSLVLVGLLAGGLAAGAAIAVLTWLSNAREGIAPPPPPPPPPVALATDDAEVADAGPSAAAATGAVLGGAAGTTAATDRGSGGEARGESGASESGAGAGGSSESAAGGAGGSASTGSGGSGGGERGGGGSGSGGAGDGTSGGGSGSGGGGSGGAGGGTSGGGSGGGDEGPVDPITAATRALRRGDVAECIDILDDVIARSPTPMAFRRRADCLLRAGEVSEAISDYRRFCGSVLPDHPAISEVREILEGLGQTCP